MPDPSLSNNTIFAFRPQAMRWEPTTRIPPPTAATCAAPQSGPFTNIAAIKTSSLAPGLLVVARADAIWMLNTSAADGHWKQLAPSNSSACVYSHATAIAILPLNDAGNTLRIIFGASNSRYRSSYALFTGDIAPLSLQLTGSVVQRYLVQSAVSNTSSQSYRALGRMHVSSIIASDQALVWAGLNAGDYFALYLPPFLLKSNDSAETFATHNLPGANLNVAALRVRHLGLKGYFLFLFVWRVANGDR